MGKKLPSCLSIGELVGELAGWSVKGSYTSILIAPIGELVLSDQIEIEFLINDRMSAVESTQSSLNSEAETEAAKFGEDVKYLAEFTNRQALTSSSRVIYVNQK